MQTRKGWAVEYMSVIRAMLMWLVVCCTPAIVQGLETPTPTSTATPRPCVGDCNQDAHVTIDELVAMVNMALAGVGQSVCSWGDRNADGTIDVSEIVGAVDAALYGCAAAPAVTPAPTPSPTGTPPVCGNGKVEPPETCDDANTVNGDGCERCVTQPGFTCVGEPSSCYFVLCPVPNATCSGPPSARSKTTPTPPRETLWVRTPTLTRLPSNTFRGRTSRAPDLATMRPPSTYQPTATPTGRSVPRGKAIRMAQARASSCADGSSVDLVSFQ